MYLRNNPALRYIDDNPQDENQSILKAINLEYSLEGLTLKLKLQYFGQLMQSQLIGKDSDSGKG